MNGDDETPWTIQISRPAQKALRRLPSERDRLLRGISALPAGDVVRLQGTTDEFRLRIGDWRVRFPPRLRPARHRRRGHRPPRSGLPRAVSDLTRGLWRRPAPASS